MISVNFLLEYKQEIQIFISILSMVLSAYFIILAEGVKLLIKGVRLFNDKYEELKNYEKICFNTLTISTISLFVIIVFYLINYLKRG